MTDDRTARHKSSQHIMNLHRQLVVSLNIDVDVSRGIVPPYTTSTDHAWDSYQYVIIPHFPHPSSLPSPLLRSFSLSLSIVISVCRITISHGIYQLLNSLLAPLKKIIIMQSMQHRSSQITKILTEPFFNL